MTIDKELLTRLRADLEKPLNELAGKYGLRSLALGRATYDPAAGTFTFKLEGMAQGGMSKEAQRYDLEREYCKGWPERDSTIQWGGESFKVTGMGQGGAIYVTNPAGKGFRLKRAAFERTFGGYGSPSKQ